MGGLFRPCSKSKYDRHPVFRAVGGAGGPPTLSNCIGEAAYDTLIAGATRRARYGLIIAGNLASPNGDARIPHDVRAGGPALVVPEPLLMTERLLRREILPRFAGRVPRMLDLGCGTGLFLKRRQTEGRRDRVGYRARRAGVLPRPGHRQADPGGRGQNSAGRRERRRRDGVRLDRARDGRPGTGAGSAARAAAGGISAWRPCRRTRCCGRTMTSRCTTSGATRCTNPGPVRRRRVGKGAADALLLADLPVAAVLRISRNFGTRKNRRGRTRSSSRSGSTDS